MFAKLSFLLVFLSLSYFPLLSGQSTVTQSPYYIEVQVEGIGQIKGDLRISLYNENNEFASASDIMDYRVVSVDDKSMSVAFEVKEAGDYAVAIMHDVSANGKMDYNLVGYPKEPYGFSSNPGIWHRVPTFEECSFEVNQDLKIKLEL